MKSKTAHIICMYCQKEVRTEQWEGDGECTSHGICLKCLKENHPDTYKKMKKAGKI